MDTLTFGNSSRTDRALRRAVAISVAAHLAAAGFLLVNGLIKHKPVLKRNLYLFDMVEPPPQVRATFPTPSAVRPVEAPKQKKEKAVKTAKAKALAVVKEKRKETEKETPKTEPAPVEKPQETLSKESEAALDNQVSITQPGFPFSYYDKQIFAGIIRNWNQVPQELLGSEEQLVVVVKFELLKDGQVMNVSIAESSWNSILDGLALRAVEKAKIPPIPGEDQTLTVTCRLVLKRR